MAKRLSEKEERKQIRKTAGIIEKKKERKIKTKEAFKKSLRQKRYKPAKKPSKKRMAASRARRAKTILSQIGGIKETSRGAGRPKGTYKYGMPIQQFKQLQSKRLEQIRRYQQAQQMKLSRRGITPQQIKQMQMQRTMEERTPQIQRLEKPFKGDGPEQSVDEELEFNKWRAKEVLSPSAEAILTRLRKTQNMGKVANIRQQRIQEERRIISQNGNLMKAHENMVDVRMDFTGVDSETNILMAPSVFRENPENNIMRTKRANILQTMETGNNLRFGR